MTNVLFRKRATTLLVTLLLTVSTQIANAAKKQYAFSTGADFASGQNSASQIQGKNNQPQDNGTLDDRMTNDRYPIHPEGDMTQGSLCEKGDSFRYPERVRYCERNVESDLKKRIIADYDRKFGYKIGSSNRTDFKIDHYIPLCMGGSNEVNNLWPQHKTVFEITDPFEPQLCDLMAAGKITQKDAVLLIKRLKNHLAEAGEIEAKLRLIK